MPDNEAPKPATEPAKPELALPEPFHSLKWLKDTRPKNAQEAVVYGGVVVFTALTLSAVGDGAYGAYKHSKGVRRETAKVAEQATVSAVEHLKQFAVYFKDQPIPTKPAQAPISFAQDSINTSNSTSQTYMFKLWSTGGNVAGITPGIPVSGSTGSIIIRRDGKAV